MDADSEGIGSGRGLGSAMNPPAKKTKRSAPRASGSALDNAQAIDALTVADGSVVEAAAVISAAQIVSSLGGYLAVRLTDDGYVEFVALKQPRRSPTQGRNGDFYHASSPTQSARK